MSHKLRYICDMSKGAMSAPSAFSRAILAEIAELRRVHDIRQEDIATAIGKTQPYVSARVNGQYPWTTNDLELLAPPFGMTAFGLVASARRWNPPATSTTTDLTALSVAELEALPNVVTPEEPEPDVRPARPRTAARNNRRKESS